MGAQRPSRASTPRPGEGCPSGRAAVRLLVSPRSGCWCGDRLPQRADTGTGKGTCDVPMSSAPMATPGVAPRPDELSEAALLERLALLKPLAAANRGPIRAGDARRVAGEEYAWLIDLALRQGLAPRRLAQATGSTWLVLRARLARHGYRTTPPTMTPYRGPAPPQEVDQSCQRGHAFDETNTYRYTDAEGAEHRVCRRCRADRMKKRRAATKAARESRLRRDLGTLSGPSVPGRPRLDMNGALDLVEQVTGRRPAAATLRAYLSRGTMPSRGADGLFAEQELRQWLQQREPRADAATIARFQRRLARVRTPAAQARAVTQARAAHLSWADIGEPLGLTRQQAHLRFASAN